MNRSAEEKTAFILTKDIKSGEQITTDMIQKVKITSKDLPKSVFLDSDEIVGKYAVTNLNEEDLVNSENLSVSPLAESTILVH